MRQWKGNKPVIGLMGGIGSGKSLVARLFAAQGCAVIDADALARAAIDDPHVKQTIVQWWGSDVIAPDGKVNRKAIADIVFTDPAQLRRLEGITHPRVIAQRAAMREQYLRDDSVPAIVDDTPLLVEKNMQGECDVLVFVDVPLETRVARVQATRGWTRDELISREKMQTSLDIKRNLADYVVQNDADELVCETRVRRVLSQILQRDSS